MLLLNIIVPIPANAASAFAFFPHATPFPLWLR